MARSKIDFCGRLRIIDKYEGETMANVLAIEFLTDTTNAYTGFEIAFTEKPGRSKSLTQTEIKRYLIGRKPLKVHS